MNGSAAPLSPSVETAQLPAWRVVGAAVMGVSHQRMGLPCQDAQGCRLLPDGTLLVALSDGAGSARFSDRGAQRAVEAGLEALAGSLDGGAPETSGAWEILLREAFAAAREAVLRLADEDLEEASTREYACTLTLAAASAGRLAAGQIGDGVVVASGADDELFAVTHLQRGEYANETHFLTQNDALDRLTVDVVERPVRGLAVMSDGLIRLALKMPEQDPHPPFFAPLFRFVNTITEAQDASAQLAAFLNSERVNARTDDDKSLVLAVRVLAAEAPAQAAGEQPALDRERK